MRDEETLRRFVACRDTGDAEGARRWWARLVEDNHDRVVAMVAIWARDGRLSADEREEAVQRALIKAWRNMASTFRGASTGEWVNALKACVAYACTDVQRAAAKRSAREAPLAEPTPERDDEWRAAELAVQAHNREQERVEARDFVAWALRRVANERRRTVIERSLDGVPADAIAAELGVTMENLYQLRSRGLKDLAMLKEQWDA